MTSISNRHVELQEAPLTTVDFPIAGTATLAATLAVEPDNSAHADLSSEQTQAAGTTTTATEPEGGQGEDSQTPVNKYGYEVFAGREGKRRLDRILQNVLTAAAHRTWRYSDEYVAPGSVCYVGPHRLAQDIRPEVRKIEMDFKLLRDKGLMRVYPDHQLVKQPDGQYRLTAVIVKDFSALYDLAYEYYLWELSPHYIPPSRDYLELMLASEELTLKLRRFDKYRRIIDCRKPGRKSCQPVEPTYQEIVALHAVEDAENAQTPTTGENPKKFLNEEKKTQPSYRESRNPQVELKRISISNPKKEEFVCRTAIGNTNDIRSTQTGSGTRGSESDTVSKSKPLSSQKETGRKTAKDVNNDLSSSRPQSAQEKAAAALADIIPPEHWQQLHQQTGGQRVVSKALVRAAQQPRWSVPDWLVREIAKQAQELRDDPKVLGSVISRAAKVARTAIEVFGLTDPQGAEVMIKGKLYAARKRTDQHWDEINPRRRMSYLMECFINNWEFTSAELLFLESEEPLFRDSDIGEFIDHLQHSYERSGVRANFEVWAADQLDKVRTKKRQKRQQSQQRRQ